MNADVQITTRAPTGELGNRLLSFLQLAESTSSVDKIAKAGAEVDGSLGELLKNFPGEMFWPAIAKLDVVDASPDEKDVVYYLDFKSVDYPYAVTFVQQIDTWLRAIGCTGVDTSLTYNFSQLTQTNILYVGGDYKRGRLAVFLGAGVSRQVGLPLWGELLSRMAESYIEKDGARQAFKKDLQARDLREQARWLKRTLGTEYLECVRQALYRDAYRSGVSTSPVIEVLSKMPGLRAICNYNYDDLLERHPGTQFRAVASAQEWYSRDDIPVYHVHGLLPYIGPPRGDLVLSEDDYHKLANNPLHWANVVQLNLLQECTCLFIGISCTDPNLRRILDLVGNRKSGDTYIIQKMEDVDGEGPGDLKAWSVTKEFDSDCFSSIYLRTIWIHSYNEIPEILEACIDLP